MKNETASIAARREFSPALEQVIADVAPVLARGSALTLADVEDLIRTIAQIARIEGERAASADALRALDERIARLRTR